MEFQESILTILPLVLIQTQMFLLKWKYVKVLLLIICTGCTIVRIDTESIDNITSVVLSKENILYNRVGKGYKYYLPRGASYMTETARNWLQALPATLSGYGRLSSHMRRPMPK